MRIPLLLPLFLAAACGPQKQDDTGDPCAFKRGAATVITDSEGSATTTIDLAEGDLELQVLASRDDGGATTIDSLIDPAGTVVWSGADWSAANDHEYLTSAPYPTTAGSAFDWPVRGSDVPLSAGTWTVSVGAWRDGGGSQNEREVQVETIVRQCTAETVVLPVTLAFTDGLEEDAGVHDAFEAALEGWRALYAGVGITLDVTETTTDMDPTLVNPSVGDPEYADLYAASGTTGVLVVVGETIADFEEFYGYTGFIPGPASARPNSAIAIAWLTLAGPDGVFDDEETATTGALIAHEAGHYLSLLHPVETSWDWYDPLDDTEQCVNQSGCVRKLGSNLMFPWVDADGSLITDEQRAMMRNWIVLQ